MDRMNYRNVLKMLNRSQIYNCYRGVSMDFVNCSRIDINNATGRAGEVLSRIVSYVDAMLYEVDVKEPKSVSDRFVFLFDGKRFPLNVNRMAQDADEADWEAWKALREKILNAAQIRIEYRFVMDADESEDLCEEGLKHMLDDLLADGRLADCVTFSMQCRMNGGGFDEGEGLEAHYRRYLWINGLHNGQYHCGELPFEQNESLIRRCSGWRQSGDTTEEEGIILRLHPKTSPVLLNRLRKAVKDFERKVNCEMEICLSSEDIKRVWMANNAGYVTASMTDKKINDKDQLNFPDLRVYFSSEEVQALLNRYLKLSGLFTKHASSRHTPDELERVNFLWTLALMCELEGPNRKFVGNGWVSHNVPPTDDFMNVFHRLPEDVRLKLYATRDYIRPTDQESDHWTSTEDNYRKKFYDTHSGLGDLSRMDGVILSSIYEDGYYIRLNMIYLNGIEDVRLMCDFLNELKQIELLAQAETGAPVFDRNDFRYPQTIYHLSDTFELHEDDIELTGAALEKLESVPHLTLREYQDALTERPLEGMNLLTANRSYRDGLITFETEDENNWTRLRFRLENNKYIYEIAQIEQ